MLVCIDTQILIWGVRKEATQGQQKQIPRAEYLLQFCDEKRYEIVIPSIVVAEFISGIPEGRRKSAIEHLSKAFQIAPFNLKAASIFAKLSDDKGRGCWHSYEMTGYPARN